MTERTFPEERLRMNEKGPGYTVEARLMQKGGAAIVNGMAIGPTWVKLHFQDSPIGVPKGRVYGGSRHTTLLTYPAAQALRWWFIASAETYGLETRLIEHRCECTFVETAIGPVEHIDDNYGLVATKSEGHAEDSSK